MTGDGTLGHGKWHCHTPLTVLGGVHEPPTDCWWDIRKDRGNAFIALLVKHAECWFGLISQGHAVGVMLSSEEEEKAQSLLSMGKRVVSV